MIILSSLKRLLVLVSQSPQDASFSHRGADDLTFSLALSHERAMESPDVSIMPLALKSLVLT